MARQIGEIGQDGLMHEASTPSPSRRVFRFRQHGNEFDVGVLRRPGLGNLKLVQTGTIPGAPVNMHRAIQLQVQRLQHNRLDRREARTARQKDHWLIGFAQIKAAMRAIEAQDIPHLHRAKHLISKQPTRHMANMELKRCSIVRRIGYREATALAILEQDIDVLTRMELEHFCRRQTQGEHRHIGGGLFQAFNTAWQRLHGNIRRATHIFYFNRHITLWHSATEQRKTGFSISHCQCGFTGFTMVHSTRRNLRPAGTTATGTATIRHQQIMSQRGFKNGLVAIGTERRVNRIKCHLMRHIESCMSDNAECAVKTGKALKPYNTAMPLKKMQPPRAVPRRFRRPRLLLAGCGDVAARIATDIGNRYRIRALLRHAPDSTVWQNWRALGTTPITADLDNRASLKRLRGLATQVIYLAPPADNQSAEARTDLRLNRFMAALHGARSLPCRLVLIGTTGVYGNCQGAFVHETRPINPQTARGQRRAAAEATLRHWVRTRTRSRRLSRISATKDLSSNAGSILRVPGIYAGNRLPVERLKAGTAALQASDDTWTNHIHADDLARISWLCLTRGKSLRAVNASDCSSLKMGDWFDAVADAAGLARPQRLPRTELKAQVSPMLYSFMSESRRLDNKRLLQELRIRLRYPTVHDFLATLKVPPC